MQLTLEVLINVFKTSLESWATGNFESWVRHEEAVDVLKTIPDRLSYLPQLLMLVVRNLQYHREPKTLFQNDSINKSIDHNQPLLLQL
jgi:hypothetical protein